jgi:hypothetical protein
MFEHSYNAPLELELTTPTGSAHFHLNAQSIPLTEYDAMPCNVVKEFLVRHFGPEGGRPLRELPLIALRNTGEITSTIPVCMSSDTSSSGSG